MDSCYFDFYYPDLQYFCLNNEIVNEPMSYHHELLKDYFKKGKLSMQYIEDIVNNENYYDKDYLESLAQKSISELRKRYHDTTEKYTTKEMVNNIKFISVADFIENNYKNQLLFYSMNHPTKVVLQYIASEIIAFLKNDQIQVDIHIDPLANNAKCILYKSIKKVVNFDISNHLPKFPEEGESELTLFVNKYYASYKSIFE